MKTKLFSLLLLACTALACDSEVEPPDEGNRRPQTIFEGKWTWVETEGVGIAGPYRSDSTTAGYSLLYDFGFSELQMYKDAVKYERFSYSFTVSEKQEEQRLTLINKTMGGELTFLWEIKTLDNKNYLILRNVEPCCDNTFAQYFRLIAGPNLNGSK